MAHSVKLSCALSHVLFRVFSIRIPNSAFRIPIGPDDSISENRNKRKEVRLSTVGKVILKSQTHEVFAVAGRLKGLQEIRLESLKEDMRRERSIGQGKNFSFSADPIDQHASAHCILKRETSFIA
jgi:hypothetical protein